MNEMESRMSRSVEHATVFLEARAWKWPRACKSQAVRAKTPASVEIDTLISPSPSLSNFSG